MVEPTFWTDKRGNLFLASCPLIGIRAEKVKSTSSKQLVSLLIAQLTISVDTYWQREHE